MITVGSIIRCEDLKNSHKIGKVLWIQEGGRQRTVCLLCKKVPVCVAFSKCELLFLNCFGTFYTAKGEPVSKEEVERFCATYT